ncbi:hypothetical protein C5167_026904 [Papaver somniferum]|nr:hypothetical protein C5167_026904 [Papaver somniferum]
MGAVAALGGGGNPMTILDGIFVAIKDDIDCSAYPSVRQHGSTKSAQSKLRSCGAILIGKANMHELDLGTTGNNPNYGTARNPQSLDRYTGGSSSGPAAIVASGLCSAALGTDGGGWTSVSYFEKEEVRVLLRKDPIFWTYRPFTEQMVRAAADDVCFLLHIYHNMMTNLNDKSLLATFISGSTILSVITGSYDPYGRHGMTLCRPQYYLHHSHYTCHILTSEIGTYSTVIWMLTSCTNNNIQGQILCAETASGLVIIHMNKSGITENLMKNAWKLSASFDKYLQVLSKLYVVFEMKLYLEELMFFSDVN